MAFDMGFDFRGTSGYVTDPAYGVPVLGEAYPHTYTNGNGDSINAGWNLSINIIDRDNTNDARIAGINYSQTNAGGARVFQVDLSSGSAPGAGSYTVDIAAGDATSNHPTTGFKLLDNATTLIDGTNGGAGTATTADQYLDATVSLVTATATWTGATVSKTFATTTALLDMTFVSDANCLAHFRLTLQAAGAAAKKLVSSLILLGVGT